MATESARKGSGKIPQMCGVDMDRLSGALRARYPAKTAACVAADLGVPARSVEHWLSGGAPHALIFAQMVLAYGPDFLCALCPRPPEWLQGARRAERLAALENEQARISAEIAGLSI